MADPTPRPENTVPPVAPRKGRSRRVGLIIGLVVLLLLVAFHQPLMLHAIRFGAIWMAQRKQMALEFQIGGNLYSELRIKNLSASAQGPGALRQLKVHSAEIRYSLADLFRYGSGEFLKALSVHQASAVVEPAKAPRKAKKPIQIKAPVAIPNELQIRDSNLLVKTPEGDWGFRGGELTLSANQPGVLEVQSLEIPGGRELQDLSGTTWYTVGQSRRGANLPRERRITVGSVVLTPEITVREVSWELSEAFTSGGFGVKARLEAFQGTLDIDAAFTQGFQTTRADIRASSEGVSLAAAGNFIRVDGVGGTLESFRARMAGDLNRWASWTGVADAKVHDLRQGKVGVDQATATLEFRDGTANWFAQTSRGQAVALLSGTGELPQQPGPMREASGEYQAWVPDLAEVASLAAAGGKEIPGPITGSLEAAGTYRLRGGRLRTELILSGTDLAQGRQHGERLVAEVDASAPFPGPMAELMKGLEARVSARLGAFGSGEYRADAGTAELAVRGNRVELKEVQVNRGVNHLGLHGTYQSPGESLSLAQGELEAWVDLRAPSLETIAPQLGGALAVQGQVSRRSEAKDVLLDGHLALSGSALRFQQFVTDSLAGEIEVVRNQALLKGFRVDFNQADFAWGTGEVYLGGTYPYRAQVEAKVKDLAIFEPLLRAAGREEPLGGAVELGWSGTGAQGGHAGMVNLNLRNGRFGTLQALEALVSGTYSGQDIRFDRFRVASNQGSVETSLYYADSLLSIQNLSIRQGKLVALAGNAFVPLDLKHWKDPAARIPAGGEIAVDLFSQAIDLKALAASLKQEWPVSGTISAHLQARGTVEDLKASFRLQGMNLKTSHAEKLAPAKLDLGLNLQNQRLALKAIFSQPQIQPLQVVGEMPFDLRKALEEKNLDENAPIQMRAVMARSSLAFLADTLPDVRYLEGEMSLDARVKGTISAPILTGSARFNVPALRFRKATMPSVANLQSSLVFENEQLTIARCQGEIGGGPFRVVGKVSFPKITEPVLDLRVNAQNLLVQRNNALTLRVNSDLLVEGPIQSGTVSGTVGITNSRFFREIEILPIGLPGRPTRRAPKMQPQLVLPKALHGWSFDVRIRTDDPFKLRSNLARGEMGVALAFQGSGASPGLDGQVQIQNLTATLPFSKMNVDYGHLYFDPRTGLDPKLDIHGTSDLREYHIDVYIHGTAQDPQSTLTSDPPLPQEDIVALLATGATAKEISGNPDVLAGRAAVLLFDRVYRKVFKKNAPGSEESVPSRIQFDFGGVSSTTGQQELRTQFKMTDNIYLIGEVGIQGEVGGKIKYVLRFR